MMKIAWICVAFLENSNFTKGQIESEWIYDAIDFPNNQCKNLKDFWPESLFEVKISTDNFEYTCQTQFKKNE